MRKSKLSSFSGQASLMATVVFLLWAIEFVDFLLHHRLDQYGIQPRTPEGLLGILVAPFLHANIFHLLANTGALIVFGWLTMAMGAFFEVAVAGALWSGLGVWLTGYPHTVTLGASGVIFAFMGFVMLRGFYDRKPLQILVSLWAIGTYWSSLVIGFLPLIPFVSWQAHLFGFLGGVHMARTLRHRK